MHGCENRRRRACSHSGCCRLGPALELEPKTGAAGTGTAGASANSFLIGASADEHSYSGLDHGVNHVAK
jgi:hypothetical protein